MKRLHRLFLFFCLVIVFFPACDEGRDGLTGRRDTANRQRASIEEEATEVEAFGLAEGPFRQELLANGKLEAVRRANLKFPSVGIIKTIEVSEGGRAKAGQLLATLANEAQQHAVRQSRLRVRKAQIDYEDLLLQQGYRLQDTSSIPLETREIAHLRSGLTEAELDLQRAERELDDTYLFAPFDGTIANLKARAHNATTDFEHICTVVDDRDLFVKFSVLEQDLPFIRGGQTLDITPFSDREAQCRGKLSGINPQVDGAGMVAVRGSVRNGGGKLVDGMAVSVSVSRTVVGQLAVPKEAVLDRQGRKVVFTVSDEGRAHWNYVAIGMENSTQYTIAEGLRPGDRVIHKGNFNLSHDKPVRITETTRE